MAAEEEPVLRLFDFYWFQHQILTKAQIPPPQQSINVRCYSDQMALNPKQQSFVTQSPKLQTIFSGTEIQTKSAVAESRAKEKKKKSKSMSELEFEELKGFMDLGFVFSEKDKNSSLVSIIPGLHRLGKQQQEEEEEEEEEGDGYLSAAWDDVDKCRKVRIPIPPLGNEMEIKNHLRFWAHSVASVVR